jgi:hypothetical protein
MSEQGRPGSNGIIVPLIVGMVAVTTSLVLGAYTLGMTSGKAECIGDHVRLLEQRLNRGP